MISGLFEVRFKGLTEDGSEAVFGYAATEEAAQRLVDWVTAGYPGWSDVHYIKVTVH